MFLTFTHSIAPAAPHNFQEKKVLIAFSIWITYAFSGFHSSHTLDKKYSQLILKDIN